MKYYYPINEQGEMIIKVYKSSPNEYLTEGVFNEVINRKDPKDLGIQLRRKIEEEAIEFKQKVKQMKVVGKNDKEFNGDPRFKIEFIKNNSISYFVSYDFKPHFRGELSDKEIVLFWEGFNF